MLVSWVTDNDIKGLKVVWIKDLQPVITPVPVNFPVPMTVPQPITVLAHPLTVPDETTGSKPPGPTYTVPDPTDIR